MVRHQISEDLKTFIKEHVRSVFGLEILLFLHRNEGKGFRATDVARELGFETDVAQEHLVRLYTIGLLIGSDSDSSSYCYQPADDAIRLLVDGLAVAYSKQRVPILSLILSDRKDRIRSFAEAFRLIRGSD